MLKLNQLIEHEAESKRINISNLDPINYEQLITYLLYDYGDQGISAIKRFSQPLSDTEAIEFKRLNKSFKQYKNEKDTLYIKKSYEIGARFNKTFHKIKIGIYLLITNFIIFFPLYDSFLDVIFKDQYNKDIKSILIYSSISILIAVYGLFLYIHKNHFHLFNVYSPRYGEIKENIGDTTAFLIFITLLGILIVNWKLEGGEFILMLIFLPIIGMISYYPFRIIIFFVMKLWYWRTYLCIHLITAALVIGYIFIILDKWQNLTSYLDITKLNL